MTPSRRRWFPTQCLAAGLASCAGLAGFAQAPPSGYQSELAAARAEIVRTACLTIRDLDLGDPHPGKNNFVTIASNSCNDTLTLGLDLRAVPGFWLSPSVQGQFLFPLAPHQERQIQAEYEFVRLSAEATLRLRFFFPEVRPGGVTQFGRPFFERKYALGRHNPADDFELDKLFEMRATDHFVVYCSRSLALGSKLDAVAGEREAAYRRISELLGVSAVEPIRLVFYADAASKTRDTGDTGDGSGYDDTIIEVYGKVDPFHELTHVLADRWGDPPALFNEGLAVYVSERMGADALKDLGSPGMKVDDAVAAHRLQGHFIPLDTLFAFSDIGPEASQPDISYPEAASFVKFLISRYGLERFHQAYRTLQNTSAVEGIRKNKEEFRAIYGRLPAEMEADWLATQTPRAQ